MEIIKSKLLFISFPLILFSIFPLLAFADGYYIATSTESNSLRCYYYQGLVPCGIDINLCRVDDAANSCKTARSGWQSGSCIGSNPKIVTTTCKFCHSFVMFNGIINFVLFKLVPAVGVLMIVIAGFHFFAVPQSPGSIETGKKILTTVVIGIVILFISWLLLSLFFTAMGVKSEFQLFSEQNMIITCPMEQP